MVLRQRRREAGVRSRRAAGAGKVEGEREEGRKLREKLKCRTHL